MPLIKNVLKPLAESALIPLELTAAADAGTYKKNLRTGMITLIISNEAIDHIKKIVKSLQESAF